ncbi:Ribonuclease S-7 [Glycine soja]
MIMNSKFLLVLLLTEILNCEAQYFNANPYDYLELALRWPNSYCLTHEDGCMDIVPQYFTISYFRPRKMGGPDLQYCRTPITLSNSIIETNKYDLLRFWPDLTTDNFIESKLLWRDQGKKFGPCCYMMPDDYIKLIRSKENLDKCRILQTFKKTLGLNVSIVCESDRSGNVYIAEVHQCVDISGTMQKDVTMTPSFPIWDFNQIKIPIRKRPKRGFNLGASILVSKVYDYIRGVKPTVSSPAISPKMSFILLLVKRNRLLTLDKTTFLNKGFLYPLCSNEAESNAHLFFSCKKYLQVWTHIRDLAPFHRRFTSLSTSGVQGKFRCLTITITDHCIWLSRNKLIFEDYQFSVIEVISKIKFLMYRQVHLLHLF